MLLATSSKYYYKNLTRRRHSWRVRWKQEGSDEPDGVLDEDLRGVRRRLGVAAVVSHEPDADALVDDDSCGVLSVLSYEADALDEAGVESRVVLLFFDAAVSMVAPHRRSRAVLLSARLAYGSHRS